MPETSTPATLVSVNVGLPKDIVWKNRTVHTGVWKYPVNGPRMVRRLNIDGDGQGDLGGHGGENRAVLVYQLDSYRHWATVLGRDDLVPGNLGENFTVDGLPDDQVCIGDRYQIGGAVLEVTQPRVTCYRVGIRMGEPQMAALLVSHRRPGFYCRVITEGEVEAGQTDHQARLRARTGHASQRSTHCSTCPAIPATLSNGPCVFRRSVPVGRVPCRTWSIRRRPGRHRRATSV